jgi:hypothetical protein
VSLQQFRSLVRHPRYRCLDNLLDFGRESNPFCCVYLHLVELSPQFLAARHTHRCRRWHLENRRRRRIIPSR